MTQKIQLKGKFKPKLTQKREQEEEDYQELKQARRIQSRNHALASEADIQRLAATRFSGTANSYRYYPSNPISNPNPTISHQDDSEAAIQQAEATRISGTIDSYRYQPNPDADLPPTYNTLIVDNETQQPPPYSLLKF